MKRSAEQMVVYANDVLKKTLVAPPDSIMGMCADMVDGTALTDADMKKIIKQVFEVIRIRNNLALLLFQTNVGDPRQFELFDDDVTPKDFE